jgi:hypothetical protein
MGRFVICMCSVVNHRVGSGPFPEPQSSSLRTNPIVYSPKKKKKNAALRDPYSKLTPSFPAIIVVDMVGFQRP